MQTHMQPAVVPALAGGCYGSALPSLLQFLANATSKCDSLAHMTRTPSWLLYMLPQKSLLTCHMLP